MQPRVADTTHNQAARRNQLSTPMTPSHLSGEQRDGRAQVRRAGAGGGGGGWRAGQDSAASGGARLGQTKAAPRGREARAGSRAQESSGCARLSVGCRPGFASPQPRGLRLACGAGNVAGVVCWGRV
eukprot:2160399-Rhodomonas_salina.1